MTNRLSYITCSLFLAIVAHADATPKWTDKPTLDAAPAKDLTGSLDGRAVALAGAKLALTGTEWKLTIGNLDSGGDPGFSVGSLAGPLKKGLKVDLPMGAASDTWAMVPGKKDPTIMDNWNGPQAAVVAEITDYKATPCTKKQVGKPVGTASGRVVAMLKGFQTTKDSWVAGTFKDAPVICEAVAGKK